MTTTGPALREGGLDALGLLTCAYPFQAAAWCPGGEGDTVMELRASVTEEAVCGIPE